MAIIIDGKMLAEKVKEEVKTRASRFAAAPTLAVILVGNNPASEIYVRGKEKDCKECGIASQVFYKTEDISEWELLNLIDQLNLNYYVDGILVQMPLPPHINTRKVIEMINPNKDVDCFHPINVGKLAAGEPNFLPCTPAGVMRMLQEYEIEITGKNCVVIGRSNIVGKPMSQLLLQADGTVMTCHSKTRNLGEITKQADILVAAVGKKGLVTADMVKDGAVVMDIGMNRVDGKLYGDVDFEEVEKKASFITPVPGGVGPMTRAMLMENVVKAKELVF